MIRENSIMTSRVTDEKRGMTVSIYTEWMRIIHDVRDTEYQKYLCGVLTKYYVASARRQAIHGWKVEGLDFRFALRYALNWRERLHVLLFNFFPKVCMKV